MTSSAQINGSQALEALQGSNEVSFNKLDSTLVELVQTQTVELPSIIVRIDSEPESIKNLIAENGGNITEEISLINALVVEDVSLDLISDLAVHPNVAYISADDAINVSSTSIGLDANVPAAPGDGQTGGITLARVPLDQVSQEEILGISMVPGVETPKKELIVTLDRQFDRFTADAIAILPAGCNYSKFEVELDGQSVFSTPKLSQDGASARVDLNLNGRSQLKLTITQNGNTGSCRFENMIFQNAWLYLSQEKEQDNLLINGDFSNNLGGWIAAKRHSAVETITGADVYSGVSVKLGSSNGETRGLIYQTVEIPPNKTYVLEAVYSGGTATNHLGLVRVNFMQETSNGRLKTVSKTFNRLIYRNGTGNFAPLRMVFTPSDDITHIRVNFINGRNPIIIDQVSLVEANFDQGSENPNDHLHLLGASEFHEDGITGAGVGIAIVDTGIRDGMLGKPTVLNYNAISASNTGTMQVDAHGHGTLMAGMAAGANPGSMAPGADIISIKALKSDGSGRVSYLLNALDFIAENHNRLNIRVVNLSIQGPVNGPYWENPINQAVERLWDMGIVVVAAAGNTGPDAGSITTPGNDPFVITVGSYTDNYTVFDRSDDFIPPFSAAGPTEAGFVKPDIIVPGAHIRAFVHSDSLYASNYPALHTGNGLYRTAGTSAAAALTSGAVALLLEEEPDLTPDEVKYRLMAAAKPALDADGKLAFSIYQQGAGMLWLPDTLLDAHDGKVANVGMEPGEDYVGPAVYDSQRRGIVLLGPDLQPLPPGEDFFWDGDSVWSGENHWTGGNFLSGGRSWAGTDYWSGGRSWAGTDYWPGGRSWAGTDYWSGGRSWAGTDYWPGLSKEQY